MQLSVHRKILFQKSVNPIAKQLSLDLHFQGQTVRISHPFAITPSKTAVLRMVILACRQKIQSCRMAATLWMSLTFSLRYNVWNFAVLLEFQNGCAYNHKLWDDIDILITILIIHVIYVTISCYHRWVFPWHMPEWMATFIFYWNVLSGVQIIRRKKRNNTFSKYSQSNFVAMKM